MANSPALNTLWIGGDLHFIHQLCLGSALYHGHSVRLFCYEEVRGIPEGVEVVSADEIIPREKLFYHQSTGSPAPFADRFRIELIAKGFGIWVDTDVLLLKPLRMRTANLFGWENDRLIGNAILGLDTTTPHFAALRRYIEDDHLIPPWWPWHRRIGLEASRVLGYPRHIRELSYGTTGPDLLTWWAGECGLSSEAQPIEAFYPLPYKLKQEVFRKHSSWQSLSTVPETVVAVHLWFQGLKGGIGVNATTDAKVPSIETGSFLQEVATQIGLKVP